MSPMTPEQRQNFGCFFFDELEKFNDKAPATYVIEGLLQEGSLNIAVGDSGEGKTPLAYQMALCVANGVPFLGRRTTKGPAVYIDLENGTRGIEDLVHSLSRHLYCPSPKNPDFAVVVERNPALLGQILVEIKPKLVIIDSLRAFEPEAEKTEKVGTILNDLRTKARRHNTAILFIHHIRKPKEDAVAPPPNQSVIEMLNRACGARALVNQTDTRIIFPSENKLPGAALTMLWNIRLHGQFGPVHIERKLDENGDPLGYQPLAGINLLSSAQQAAFCNLSETFTFSDAKRALCKGDESTSRFLRKAQDAGIIEHPSKKIYKKIDLKEAIYKPPQDDGLESVVGRLPETD